MPTRLPEAPIRPARVPGVPSAPVYGGGVPLQGLGEALQGVGQQALETAQRFAQERARRERVKALAGVQEQLNDFRERALLSQDPAELEQMFGEELPKLERDIVRDFGGDETMAAQVGVLVDRARSSLVGHRVEVNRRDAQATAAQLGETFARDASLLPPDRLDLREEGLLQLREGLGALDALTPAEREDAFQSSARSGAFAFLAGFAQSRPKEVLALTSQPGVLEEFSGDPLLQHLSPRDISAIAGSARTEISRRQSADREARLALEEGAYDAWLPRLYGGVDQLPRTDEVLADPVLSPKAKEHFVKVIERRAKGENVNQTNEIVANHLYRRIHDPERPDHITSFAQILPYVGNGISREDAEAFRVDITQLRTDPQAKRRDAQFSAFLRSAEKQITKATLLTPDPLGAEKFWAFQYEARRRWQAVVAEGRDPVEVLLNPQSSEFLGQLVPVYVPTRQEGVEARRRSFGLGTSSAGGPSSFSVTTSPQEIREMEQYLKGESP